MLDASRSFERFVMGSTNALAATAARRAAESPGAVYNPLVVCGGSGVGKSHLLHAIGLYATALQPDIDVHLESAELLADRVTQGIAAGEKVSPVRALGGLHLLLIDEIELLAGMSRTQEELVAIAERMIAENRQLVVSSIVSPSDLPGFIPELLDVLNRGIVVEVGPPDEEMRRALVEVFSRDGNGVLGREAAHALAAFDFADIRSLRSAVDATLEIAAAANRPANQEDVEQVLARASASTHRSGEVDAFLDDVKRTVAAVVETAPWRRRVADAILRWEGEGVRTGRLEEALDADTPPDVDRLLDGFERDAKRIVEIRQELISLGFGDAPDDPVDLGRAEEMLERARGSLPEDPEAGLSAGAPQESPLDAVARVSMSDSWFLNREKVVLDWLDIDGRLIVEPH